MTITTKRSFSGGHFELQIDGHKSTTYLTSVDGGWLKSNVIDDAVGSSYARVKHLGNFEIEPVSVEFGLSHATDVLSWIQGSWSQKKERRSGQINHGDTDLKQTYEHWFYRALITEVTFPGLDTVGKEAGTIKCKFLPEEMEMKKGDASDLDHVGGTKQKLWTNNCFRFSLDHIDGFQFANKINSFTITQGTKKVNTGKERIPTVEPTNIKFPNITGTMALAHAGPLLKWYDKYVVQGKEADDETNGQMSGTLDFLSLDRKSTLFSLNLFDVGLANVSIETAQANASSVKRVKFELFVGEMSLDGSPGVNVAVRGLGLA